MWTKAGGFKRNKEYLYLQYKERKIVIKKLKSLRSCIYAHRGHQTMHQPLRSTIHRRQMIHYLGTYAKVICLLRHRKHTQNCFLQCFSQSGSQITRRTFRQYGPTNVYIWNSQATQPTTKKNTHTPKRIQIMRRGGFRNWNVCQVYDASRLTSAIH